VDEGVAVSENRFEKSVDKRMKRKKSAILKNSKKALRASGKLLSAGIAVHSVVECAKDIAKIRELTARGEKVDEQLYKNVVNCPFDAFLGRGTTQAIVEVCFVKDGKDDRGVLHRAGDCLKAAGSTVKAIGFDLPKFVVQEFAKCLKQGTCVKKTVDTSKNVGKGALKWFTGTTEQVYNSFVNSTLRRQYCAKSAARVQECAREDAMVQRNKKMAWDKFRQTHPISDFFYKLAGQYLVSLSSVVGKLSTKALNRLDQLRRPMIFEKCHGGVGECNLLRLCRKSGLKQLGNPFTCAGKGVYCCEMLNQRKANLIIKMKKTFI
jgi:hypothetical protein